MELKLNPVRMIDFDEAKEFALGDIDNIEDKMAIAFINPKDFEEMYLTPSLKLHISNENGEVTVKFEQDVNVPAGTILMPVSIWTNQLTRVKDDELLNKNILVEVEASRDQPTKLTEILKKIKEGK
jgi:formylmethanofuran dehydrogenase subunit D